MCLIRGIFVFLYYQFHNLYKECTILHEIKMLGYFLFFYKTQTLDYLLHKVNSSGYFFFFGINTKKVFNFSILFLHKFYSTLWSYVIEVIYSEKNIKKYTWCLF